MEKVTNKICILCGSKNIIKLDEYAHIKREGEDAFKFDGKNRYQCLDCEENGIKTIWRE